MIDDQNPDALPLLTPLPDLSGWLAIKDHLHAAVMGAYRIDETALVRATAQTYLRKRYPDAVQIYEAAHEADYLDYARIDHEDDDRRITARIVMDLRAVYSTERATYRIHYGEHNNYVAYRIVEMRRL